MSERLHRLLAQHGLGSRRQVEAWIRDGRVLVNGRPAEVGQAVEPRDRVVVDGRDVTRLLAVERKLQVIVYHKPTGEMLRSRAGDDREGVEPRLPALHGGRWVAINALGYGEDGLLILANEGPFALAIARRGHEIPVEYRVRALRPRQEVDWPQMPTEVDVEGEPVTFSAVEPAGASGTNMWFRVASDRTLPRGAIRALFDAAGLKLNRAMLVRWGPIVLPRDLPRGRSRSLDGEDLDALYALAGRSRAAEQDARKRRGPRPPPDRRRKPTAARRSGSR
ncbi:MAG TPA: S4 domain-containing protein [Steroidobacteraceae bacterium]|nr:S4 domain-containing protein [Steroidobacteraceae bacterium]